MKMQNVLHAAAVQAGGPGSGRKPSGGLHDTMMKHGWKPTQTKDSGSRTITHYRHPALPGHHSTVSDWKSGGQSFTHTGPDHESGTYTSSSQPSFVDHYLGGFK